MLSGNKGEWSEIYTLFKLLGDKQLFGGDANLNKIEDLFYPIIKIIRTESGGNFEYEIDGDLVIISGGVEELRVSIQDFKDQAANLLNTIKDSTGSFKIPETELFMNSINCGTLKAKATSKTDILIVIHDPKINQKAELGFSIKSKLGGEATLLNAGKTTNFIFEVKNLNSIESDIFEINSIESRNKIQDRLSSIVEKGGVLVFDSLEQAVFKNNLVLIDSLLPNIIAEIIKLFFTTALTSVKSLTDAITISIQASYVSMNPVGFSLNFSPADHFRIV
jgi:type II restriction enzyme